MGKHGKHDGVICKIKKCGHRKDHHCDCKSRKSFILQTGTGSPPAVTSCFPICSDTRLLVSSTTLRVTATQTSIGCDCNTVNLDLEYLGTQGVQGSQGAQGSQGPPGNQGSLGIQGIQGNQGLQGTQGFNGVQGSQGLLGTQGTQGLTGVQGIQGVQGNAGSVSALLNGFDATSITLTTPDAAAPQSLVQTTGILRSQTLPGGTLTATTSVVEIEASGNELNPTVAGNNLTFTLYINALPTAAVITVAEPASGTATAFEITFKLRAAGNYTATAVTSTGTFVANGVIGALTIANPNTFDIRAGFATPAGTQLQVAQSSLFYFN